MPDLGHESPPTRTGSEPPLEALEHELTTLAGYLNAANYRFLTLLAEFDRRGGDVGWGLHSCAHWLSWKCGIGLIAARDKVRVARSLEHLPKLSEAMRLGTLRSSCGCIAAPSAARSSSSPRSDTPSVPCAATTTRTAAW